ncbi:MAG: glycosyltransferase, partial [Alphaproteobacteria bacterium]|nr:glycosyltransferase [Alphaproteobacteria bacterium]
MTRPKLIGIASFMNQAGAQEALLRVMKMMRGRGFDTEVWFLYREAAIASGDETVRVLVETDKPSAGDYATMFTRLVGALRRERPAGVVSFLPLGNVMGQTAALLAGVDCRIASQRSPRWTYGRAMRVADRVMGTIGVYAGNVAVSGSVRDSFAPNGRRYLSRMEVVHNGVYWTPSTLNAAAARARFGLPADGPLVLAISRMKPQKNFGFMIDSIARSETARLVVAGDGPLRAEVEARIAGHGIGDRVVLLGNVGRTDIPDLFRATDLFIQPSLYEGQSNALLEAMVEGKAIIASDTPAQVETLRAEGRADGGLLLAIDDPGAWGAAMDRLL